ncbi:o-succinylbenzoate synthase [Nocardioides cynanchi]|uniref:o-succinylbenzoate synthase n=1 Tax=Nocardioides cynanchi TaxID=2558918 RepID=UPI0012485922|nr:o-succinylbenzoate synthase [Nocardioides cynanchi]
MRIERVVAHRCALPLVRPFRTSFGTEYTKDVLLLEVTTDLGVGWGECVAAPDPLYSHEFNEAVLLVWRDHLVPRLMGRDLGAEEVPALLGPVRGHPMARGALELAVIDAQLRASGESFASYLGAVHARIPCGVSTGIPDDDSIDTLVREVDGYVAEGYRRVKLKIQPGWDLEPVRVIRERHPDIPLQVDANQAYSRRDIEHLSGLDEFDLILVEQPIHEEDYLGHRLLAERMRTPVCLDESVLSADNAESLIDYGACEIVNIKAGRVGGYLSARAIHDMAVARGVPVWCGGMVETGIGRAANVALAALPGFTLPGDTSASSRFFSLDVTEPFVMDAEGMMTVPTGPGLGVTPIPEVLADLSVGSDVLAQR